MTQIKIVNWVAEKQGLPEAVDVEIISQSEKAIEILWKNMYFWIAKSKCKIITEGILPSPKEG